MTGDELDAVTRLYERYAGDVHRYALRRSDRETADEITAQVFIVAWRRRSALPEDALPWLYGVARRALAEQRRGAARRKRLGKRLRGEAVEEMPGTELLDEGLARALRRLSQGDREALLLRYWEELEPAQRSWAARGQPWLSGCTVHDCDCAENSKPGAISHAKTKSTKTRA